VSETGAGKNQACSYFKNGLFFLMVFFSNELSCSNTTRISLTLKITVSDHESGHLFQKKVMMIIIVVVMCLCWVK
jgi:hypothetical protein